MSTYPTELTIIDSCDVEMGKASSRSGDDANKTGRFSVFMRSSKQPTSPLDDIIPHALKYRVFTTSIYGHRNPTDNKMIWSILYLGCIGLCRTTSVRALTLPPIQDLSTFTPSASLVNQTLPISLIIDPVAPQANPPYGPIPDPVCNGTLLGYDVNRYSCLQAWRAIPINRDTLTFGDRNAVFDVKLPRRFSSRQYPLYFSSLQSVIVRFLSRVKFQTDGNPVHKSGWYLRDRYLS